MRKKGSITAYDSLAHYNENGRDRAKRICTELLVC